MTLGTLLLIVLILLLLASVPTWPYSRGWGYRPSGILGALLLILLIMMLLGMLPMVQPEMPVVTVPAVNPTSPIDHSTPPKPQ